MTVVFFLTLAETCRFGPATLVITFAMLVICVSVASGLDRLRQRRKPHKVTETSSAEVVTTFRVNTPWAVVAGLLDVVLCILVTFAAYKIGKATSGKHAFGPITGHALTDSAGIVAHATVSGIGVWLYGYVHRRALTQHAVATVQRNDLARH